MQDQEVGAQELSPEIAKLTGQLARDPRSKAFIPLSEEYIKVGRLDAAATVLEEGLKVYPGFITALVALGKVYVQMDLPDKARPVFEEAIKTNPDNLLAHRILARIYAKAGAWNQARKTCEIVLFANPHDHEMLALQTELGQQAATHQPDGAEPPGNGKFLSTHPSSENLKTPSSPKPAEQSVTQAPSDRPGDFATDVPQKTAVAEPPAPPSTHSGTAGVGQKKAERLRTLLARIQERRTS